MHDKRISQHPPDCIPVVLPDHHKQGIVLNEERLEIRKKHNVLFAT